MSKTLTFDEPGMIKVCSWPAFYKDGLSRVPHVRMLETYRLSSKEAAFSKISKLRSRDTAQLVQEFLDSDMAKHGHTYFLDTALGAYEAWGPNNNGDAFREKEDLLLDSDEHGYRSFKQAHAFRHHVNKDPLTAAGKVVLAAYNTSMRRVELIKEIDTQKAADLISRWDDEGSLPTSMGCRVKYDQCSICDHRAKTAAEYCEHAKYAMGTVYDNGRRVCVFNPDPRFFDQSFVDIPADRIAGAMMKVASDRGMSGAIAMPKVVPSAVVAQALYLEDGPAEKTASDFKYECPTHGECGYTRSSPPRCSKCDAPMRHPECSGCGKDHERGTARCFDKTASQRHASFRGSVIWTEQQGAARRLSESDPHFPAGLLEVLAQRPLTKVAATLTHMGIVPSPREWQFLMLSAAGRQKAARELHAKDVCFEPDPLTDVELTDIDRKLAAEENFDADIAVKLAGWLPLRSCHPMYMAPRMAVFLGGQPDGFGNEISEGVSVLTTAFDKVAKDVVPPERIRAGEPGMAETMLALAVSYGIVRAAQGEQSRLLDGLRAATGTNPAVAAALLAAGAAAALGLAGRATEKTAAWAGGPAGKGFWDWVRQTPEPIHSWVLPFSAGYMSSAWYRAKQMRGEPTTAFQNVVADHPLAAGAGAAGGLAALKRAIRSMH